MPKRDAAFLTITLVVDDMVDGDYHYTGMQRADLIALGFRDMPGVQVVATARGELSSHKPENDYDGGLGYVQGSSSGPIR